jgi:hypothetical protein
MRPVSRALGQILLDHHQQTTSRHPLGAIFDINRDAIRYGDLCSRAGVPHLTRIVGGFLAEIAEWCAANGWPPINSLAVNGETRIPGEGYYDIAKWPSEVEECIRFNGYPTQTP